MNATLLCPCSKYQLLSGKRDALQPKIDKLLADLVDSKPNNRMIVHAVDLLRHMLKVIKFSQFLAVLSDSPLTR